ILLEYDQLHNDILTELGSSSQAEMNLAHYLELTVASIINQLLFGFAYHEKSQREEFSKMKDVLSEYMRWAASSLTYIVVYMPFFKDILPFKSALVSFKKGYDILTNYCNEQVQKHKENFSE
ncbi:hypothetical protein FO519_010714, partial [Halicephalobus sp. NKZ332]